MKKKKAHPSSFREPDIDFRKLVDKIEQAEITMYVEETENLKLKYVNNIQTTTSQFNSFHDSDNELAEKLTQMLNIYENNPNFSVKLHSKNGLTFVVDMDIALLNADKNNGIIKKTTKAQRTKQTFPLIHD